jgi:protein TonB
MVSGDGKGKSPTFNPRANNTGVPGGTGTGTAPPPPPPGPDLSQPPGVIGLSWNCPFPPEADADGIDQAVAVIVVTVRPDGSPLTVKVITDPGHGFGRAARMCALGRQYKPGLDRAGQPTTLTTPPMSVRFTR